MERDQPNLDAWWAEGVQQEEGVLGAAGKGTCNRTD